MRAKTTLRSCFSSFSILGTDDNINFFFFLTLFLCSIFSNIVSFFPLNNATICSIYVCNEIYLFVWNTFCSKVYTVYLYIEISNIAIWMCFYFLRKLENIYKTFNFYEKYLFQFNIYLLTFVHY